MVRLSCCSVLAVKSGGTVVSESMRVHAVKPNYSTVDAFANVVTAYILIDVCVVWRSWCGGDIRDVFPRLG